MKNLLNWIKSNVIAVVSIVAVLLAVGFLGWVHMEGSDLEARAQKEAGKISTIASYSSTIVEVPPENPDQPPQASPRLTINTPEIEQMRSVNEQMDREYQGIFAYAVDRNRAGKQVLVEGLFPTEKSLDIRYIARDRYRFAFEVMLQPASYRSDVPVLDALPRLDAGTPPPQEQIDRELFEVQETFMTKGLAGVATQLTEDETRELDKEKRLRLLEILIDRAQSIHIYANPDINSDQFPFDVDAILADADPTPSQLWEGQLELWIQQDIAAAIAVANQTDNPEASVLTAPVKRLLRMEVAPGYVGLQNLGAVEAIPNATRLPDQRYSAPANLTGSADQRQSDNFYASPTGRVSNALYDIRHARLTALVDFQRLPELFDAISNVNMMTVVGCEITGLDEYDAMAEGYIYGAGDVVQVQLTIESVWLRDWTTALMNDHVKMYLGLMEPDPLMMGVQPGMPGGGFGPGGFGPGGPGMPGGPYNY